MPARLLFSFKGKFPVSSFFTPLGNQTRKQNKIWPLALSHSSCGMTDKSLISLVFGFLICKMRVLEQIILKISSSSVMLQFSDFF